MQSALHRGRHWFEFSADTFVIGCKADADRQAGTELFEQVDVLQNQMGTGVHGQASRLVFEQLDQAAAAKSVFQLDVLVGVGGGTEEDARAENLGAVAADQLRCVDFDFDPLAPLSEVFVSGIGKLWHVAVRAAEGAAGIGIE